MITDLQKRMMNGVVSERPPIRQIHRTHYIQIPDLTQTKIADTPIKPVRVHENVIDIPDFLYERKRKRLAEEYAQRQKQLYAQINEKPSRRLRKIWRRFLLVFFDEV